MLILSSDALSRSAARTADEVDDGMGLVEPTTAAALVAAGVFSVLLFPPLALKLLVTADRRSDQSEAAVA